MLHVIRSFGEDLPAACQNTCQEAWSMFDPFLARYGSLYDVSERTTRVLRHGITLFGKTTLSVAPAVLGRMSLGFEETGFPGYLWISGKIIGSYGVDKDTALHAAIDDVYNRSTSKVIALLQTKSPGQMPDGAFAVICLFGILLTSVSFGGLPANAQTADRADARHLF